MVSISPPSPPRTRQTSPGGASIPKILAFVGISFVCLAAILAFVFSITVNPVFYLWIAGLVAQFVAGLWVLVRFFLR
jgi:hypothetical protein